MAAERGTSPGEEQFAYGDLPAGIAGPAPGKRCIEGEFIRYLNESFGTTDKIDFQLIIEPLKIGVAQAIPIALIINEAVTNSIKYAFPGDRRGMIGIDMRLAGDVITLRICDDGIGIAPALVESPSASLGLKLIRGLSEDIHGTLRITNEGGTTIFVSFSPGILD